MNIKQMSKIAGILVIFVIIGTNLNAQTTRNDVISAYNEGAKASQTDPGAAIVAFEKVVTLADQVGDEAADLKEKATKVLPGLYVKVALNAYNEKKPATEIIDAAKKASAAAEKYGSSSNKATAGKILVQGYNKMGTEFFSESDFDNALLAFDSLLLINPDYDNAIYNKALIYIRQNNNDAFEETMDTFLGKLEAGKDDERISQASTQALEYFRAAGSKANQEDNLDEALALLTKAAKYGDDKDLFYYFADVNNKQENFDLGTEYAQKGLDMETGDAEAKAKFYYQLAVAQAGKGETSQACESFKNALYGPFADASKAQRTNLKCQ
jgi:tetratricopeptide (TPR) repeat protein